MVFSWKCANFAAEKIDKSMKLSELKTGESGIILKVLGHGGFRKRIMEMGFIKGKEVEVLLNAPLQDPVKYKIMGYEVSLRHDEADLIEVGPLPAPSQDGADSPQSFEPDSADIPRRQTKNESISIAIVGNPNCGKTSLFNFASGAHARVGNYSGVTVDATEAYANFEGYELLLTDLPGTYSLSCYSPEELYVREHLLEKHPDVIINVLDSSNLERNLYLTTQLVDMHLPMVCALNMYDEFEHRGDALNIDTLQMLFGVPMVPTSFKTGMGVEDLFRTAISVYEGTNAVARHLHIYYGHEVEDGISHIQKYLKQEAGLAARYSTRFLALKLLEHDTHIANIVRHTNAENARAILAARDRASARVMEETKVDSETAIMDSKYGFIHGALMEAEFRQGTKADTYRITHRLDDILSNKYVGFPIFFLLLFVMFQTTFSLGQYPMDWIEAGVAWLGSFVESHMAEGSLRSLIVDGAIAGVGSVIVFLPQILILYFFISFMEDSGYMARAAFIMDKLMHKMGLHGKSFIPLIMGFGCNVPAIMATRTIESRRSRLITMMILPFMSCSARLPIYIMITGTFFAAQYRSWVMISLYAVGILVAVLMSKLFSSLVIKGEDTPFVMELPPYRWPTTKAIGRHTWEKCKEYLKKMGGIILVASIIVWALGYYPHNDALSNQEQQEQSYIGRLGQVVEPIFRPQGFNWKLDVSLLAGVGAKEIVASTIGILYADDDSFGELESLSDIADSESVPEEADKFSRLQSLMAADGITPLASYAYLLFILLYFPCIATIVAIKNESGSWRWALAAALYTTGIAWLVSAGFYQIGSIFF